MFKKYLASAYLMMSTISLGGAEFKACIKTVHGKFATATQIDENWIIRGSADNPDVWEEFLITIDDEGYVTLKSSHNKYLTGTHYDEDFIIKGAADGAEAWEKFHFIKNEDNSCSFKTVHNKYITATGSDNDFILRGGAEEKNSWEKFFLVHAFNMNFMKNYFKGSSFNIPVCDLAQASENAYAHTGFTAKKGFLSYEYAAKSDSSSMQAVLFLSKTDNVAIVSFQGTANHASMINDCKIGCLGKQGLREVFSNSKKNFDQFSDQLKGKDTYVCGHSLGGVAAQMIAGALNIKGSAFNTMGVRGLGLYFNYHPEFYVHNTQAAMHSGLGNEYLGKVVKHKGTSHQMSDMMSKHFNGSCSIANDRCLSDFRPSFIHQLANEGGKILFKIIRQEHEKVCDVSDELGEANRQFNKGHEDQAVEHSLKAVVAVIRLMRL
ncbi:MAG: hypothetical protein AB8C84_04910 [Oligoflexales bacterium]